MKIEIADALAVGGVVLAVVGFAFGAKSQHDYIQAKRVRSDEMLIKCVHEVWAELPGNKKESAAEVHARMDGLIRGHVFNDGSYRDTANELNAHYLSLNV